VSRAELDGHGGCGYGSLWRRNEQRKEFIRISAEWRMKMTRKERRKEKRREERGRGEGE